MFFFSRKFDTGEWVTKSTKKDLDSGENFKFIYHYLPHVDVWIVWNCKWKKTAHYPPRISIGSIIIYPYLYQSSSPLLLLSTEFKSPVKSRSYVFCTSPDVLNTEYICETFKLQEIIFHSSNMFIYCIFA